MDRGGNVLLHYMQDIGIGITQFCGDLPVARQDERQ